MTDPKLAIKQNLETADPLARADTIGLDATNDRLAESVFGCWDYVLRRNPMAHLCRAGVKQSEGH